MSVTEREIEEFVARSVAAMVFYHSAGRNPRTKELMIDDVRQIATQVMEKGLSPAAIETRIIAAIQADLNARFSPKIVESLQADFAAAFYTLEWRRLLQG